MRLHFSLLTASTDEFWVAPDDGSRFDRSTFSQDLYEIRTTPALRASSPDAPYRVSTPDSYIIASGKTLDEAMRIASQDASSSPWAEQYVL